MSIRKSFISTLVATTLLTATTLSAQDCTTGHCTVDMKGLDNMKAQKFSKMRKSTITSRSQMNRQVHIAPQNIHPLEYMNESYTIILDGQEIVRFAHDRYVMNAVEKAAYYEREGEKLLFEQPIKGIDDKIMEKSTLPQSEYYCDIPKKPVFTNLNGIYECV